MTQTTFTDNVLIDGSQDIKQLRVQGHTTQNPPIQTWEDSAGGMLAQMTGDGRLLVGDDMTPDSLIEAHRAEASTSKPKRGFHSLGQISGTLTALVQWIVQELELRGSNPIDALHTALRVRLSNMNTGTPGAGAELRGGDIEVVNDASSGSAAVPKITGLQVGITNASGKAITEAVALRLKLNNAGTITTPYALFTEGPGIVHLEDFIEVKRPAAAPGTPATDFMRVYPKSDGKLYAKNWSGVEYELTGGGGASVAGLCNGRLTLSSGVPITLNDVSAATTLFFVPFRGNQVALFNGTHWALFPFTERSLSLSGLAANTLHDIFLYDNAGTLILEGVPWNASANGTVTSISNASPRVATVPSHSLVTGQLVTIVGNSVAGNNATWRVGTTTGTTFQLLNQDGTNSSAPGSVGSGGTWQRADQNTTRATALVLQDGVYVKSGAPTRRYLGTIRTTALAGQCDDSKSRRFVWNYCNRVERYAQIIDTTGSWTYGTISWRAMRNDLRNRFEFVIGLRETLVRTQQVMYAIGGTGVRGAVGFGLDVINANHAAINSFMGAGDGSALLALHSDYPDVGYHYLQAVEYSSGVNTTFYGTYGTTYSQDGAEGRLSI